MNEFLERLLRELQQVHDPERRAELTARIAGIRARTGDFDDAKRNIHELRGICGDGTSGAVTVPINLAEGLVHHYRALRAELEDKLLGRDSAQLTLDQCSEKDKATMGRLADCLAPFVDGLRPEPAKS